MSSSQKKVLVLEDDPVVRKLIRRHLETLGVDVLEASDARAAISKLKDSQPALLCLDLMLPESSGFAVCEYMRSVPQLERVPIIVISARTSISDRALAQEMGISHYLTKPFRREEFLKLVRGLLAEPVTAP